jgi:hypothetical protein
MKKLSIVLSGALMLVGVATTTAQEAVDPAHLEIVTQAFENTLAVSSLHVESQSQTEISGLPIEGIGMQGAESFDASKAAAGTNWNAAGSRTTTLTLPNGETNLVTEFVLLDGVVYLNLEGVPAEMAQGMTIPEGWFDIAELAATSGQNVPGANFDASTLLGGLGYPIDATSVTALTELPGDTIDEQPVRVFQLTLDPAVVLESEAAGLLNVGLGGGFAQGGGFPGGGPGNAGGQFAPPADAPDLSEVTPPSPEDFEITFAVYVGADDGLVHRIYSVVATQSTGQGQGIGLTLTTITNYSAFDTPVSIQAPNVEG